MERLLGAGRKLWDGGRGRVLLSVAFGWLLVLGMRLVVPVLLPEIRAEFALSNTTLGGTVTVLWAAYAVMQFPAGVLSDRFGERSVLLWSVLLGGASVVALSLAPFFVVFLVACGLYGLGTGLYGPPRVTLTTALYSENSSTALGIIFAAGNLGATVLPVVAVFASAHYGWRAGFAFAVPLYCLLLLGLWRTAPRVGGDGSAAVNESPRYVLGRLSKSLRNRLLLLVSGAICIMVFTFQGFTAFFPTYLVEIKHLTPAFAATLFSVYFVVGAVVQPGAGYVADRYGERRVLAVLMGFHGVTLTVLPLVSGPVALGVLAALLGLRGGLGPINNSYVVSLLPEDVQGTGYGLLRTAYMGVGATGSVVVGLFADAALFDEAFVFLGALCFAATLLYLLPAVTRDAVQG